MKSFPADDRTRDGRNSIRQKYILKAVLGYAIFSLIWIFLSDMLLSAFVDVHSIQWLSTAKGFLYVLVTALMLFLMMRGIPDEVPGKIPTALLSSVFAGSGQLHRFMYVFAVLVSLAMLLVRSLIAVPFGERPLLILFMFPIILSAVVGGLGPGLVATTVTALGVSYFAFPPVHSIFIEKPHDLFQLFFLIGNGVLVSILSNALHRMRQRSEEEKQLQLVTLESIGDGVIATDIGNRVTFLNSEALRLTGWDRQEALGRPLAEVFQDTDEQALPDGESRPGNDTVAGSEIGGYRQSLLRSRDGRGIPINKSRSRIRLEDGTSLGEVLVVRDDTARRRAEEENKKLEIQLLQAQKMEAVGRLAGGVAHDFNNMLSVILGHAEIALTQTVPDDSRHEDLQEIRKAAARSASLTRQLLAFARKQTVSPKVLDLNETVVSMLKMLRRLIGEDIDLLWLPGHELHHVKIDPSQIDQMLANLAVNARDAIGGVGRVTIATANISFTEEECRIRQTVAPGDYVVLTVSDTGTGMSREVLDHIFEPFYTTKDVGKGTGLGLSTVFGIVKQNNGFVEVSSEAGAGTVFRIYLPTCMTETEPQQEGKGPKKPPRGDETVLIVEDEPAILRLGTTILQRLGYTVLTAASPNAAFQVVVDHKDAIQLLITDVVMPEMNGRDLLDWLGTVKPGLKCLYMSGYTADAIAHHGVLDEGVRFLQKPFSLLELATQVRRAIDEPRGVPGNRGQAAVSFQ